jgi:hypothetical protein
MRVVAQRVKRAEVWVGEERVAAITRPSAQAFRRQDRGGSRLDDGRSSLPRAFEMTLER